MYKIKINGQEEKNISLSNNKVAVDGRNIEWDICSLADGRLSILINHKSYNAFVVSVKKEQKEMVLRINNRLYSLAIQEPIDQLLKKMGLNISTTHKVDTIKAPMPGLVLKVMVTEGQQLKKGDPVLILEAMKMENVFKSPEDTLVKNIKIKAGQAVEKGTILIELA